MARVGYIGLGIMGASMARNLLKSGHEVVIHNRSRKIVADLVGEGAIECFSPKEVAARVDFLFTNLPDSPDVEAVLLGGEGVIEGASSGLIVIDNSTIKPETARNVARELMKSGVELLDAPVSGGDIGARSGTLTIMVGGNFPAYEKALPLLECVGKKITYIGESGAGQIAKAANQIIVAGTMVAMAEALVLVQKSGVDPQRVVDAIRKGAAQCWALDNKPEKLFNRDLGPGFKAYMQAKDLKIVLDTGRAYHAALPQTAIAYQLYESMIAMGNGELDNSAILTVLEALSGISLAADDV